MRLDYHQRQVAASKPSRQTAGHGYAVATPMPTAADHVTVLPTSFTTARLRLRLPTLADAPALIARWAGDPEVTRHMLFQTYAPGDIAAAEAFLATCLRAWDTHVGHQPWVISERGDPLAVPVGMLGVTTTRGGHAAEIGYVLTRSAWRKGYAPEALSAVTTALLRETALWRVFATTHNDNLASQRVLSKAGFVREGTLRRHLVFPNLGPEPATCTLWSFTRDDLAAMGPTERER